MKVFKVIFGITFITGIILAWTNPTLREFKEVTPTQLMIEKENGYCEKKWNFGHNKVKNYMFYSYYKFTFGCSEFKKPDYYEEKMGYKKRYVVRNYKEQYYLGILNNFYKVEFPRFYYWF